VRRFGTNEARYVTFPGLNNDSLGQQNMTPPSSNGAEFNKPVVCDKFDNEADFVHMPGNHDPGRFSFPVLPTYNAAKTILFNNRDVLKMLSNDLTNLLFVA
jgi:hypothetical protein